MLAKLPPLFLSHIRIVSNWLTETFYGSTLIVLKAVSKSQTLELNQLMHSNGTGYLCHSLPPTVPNENAAPDSAGGDNDAPPNPLSAVEGNIPHPFHACGVSISALKLLASTRRTLSRHCVSRQFQTKRFAMGRWRQKFHAGGRGRGG